MGEGKHTQGRLFADGNEVRLLIHENSGLSVAVARCAGSDAEAVANARLYAAAPDLLETCKALVAAMRRYEVEVDGDAPYSHVEMMRRADAAITRATAPMQEGE